MAVRAVVFTGRRGLARAGFRVGALAILVALFWVDPPAVVGANADRLADLAHLMAFVLGIAIALTLDRRRRS